jgi:hypothetical protein
VNDVINAGSAVRGTLDDLQNCGANAVAVGALLLLGTAAQQFASSKNIAVETIAAVPNTLWSESESPFCSSGVPLQDVAGFGAVLNGRVEGSVGTVPLVRSAE